MGKICKPNMGYVVYVISIIDLQIISNSLININFQLHITENTPLISFVFSLKTKLYSGNLVVVFSG